MEEKKSKSKKIIIIVVVLLILVAIIGVGAFYANDYAQRTIIGEEMENINATGNVDTEIKSNGKYADVEKALKDYVIEYQAIATEVADEYNNEKFTTILSADNYKNDGPNFEESKKLINDVKIKGEDAKVKLAEMVTDEYKEKRATDLGLTGKYKTLFKDSIQLDNELEEINETIDNVNNYLSKIDDVFNYLKENTGKWEVKNDKVTFNELSQLTQYNSLVLAVNTAAGKLN